MSDSVFDPAVLLNMPVTGAMDTRLPAVDAGEYTALVKDVKARSGTYSKGERQGQRFVAVDITWTIDDQGVREKTGLDSPQVRQSIMIDLTPGGGFDLGKGKNVGLGKLRAALGMNDPTVPFSFEQLKGRIARVKVTNRVDDRPDSSTRGETFADVAQVAALT